MHSYCTTIVRGLEHSGALKRHGLYLHVTEVWVLATAVIVRQQPMCKSTGFEPGISTTLGRSVWLGLLQVDLVIVTVSWNPKVVIEAAVSEHRIVSGLGFWYYRHACRRRNF